MQANIIPATLPINGEGVPVQGVLVTPGMFDCSAARRSTAARCRTGDDPGAIVISHAFWQRQFGGDPSVVGRTFGDGRASPPSSA